MNSYCIIHFESESVMNLIVDMPFGFEYYGSLPSFLVNHVSNEQKGS